MVSSIRTEILLTQLKQRQARQQSLYFILELDAWKLERRVVIYIEASFPRLYPAE